MIRLTGQSIVGEKQHRSGWPFAVAALKPLLSDDGILFDDFTDRSFTYTPIKEPRTEPWIGVFHHPHEINSPLPEHQRYNIRRLADHPCWEESRRHLVGGITLSEHLATFVRQWLGVPTIAIKHPTEIPPVQWSKERFMARDKRRVLQLGVTLRNTRAIYQLPPRESIERARVLLPAWRKFDNRLRRLAVRKEYDRASVVEMPRLRDDDYDRLLGESIVMTELYGASGSNVVVECIARGTPLLINRLPAVEEYLGSDYPLYVDSMEHAAELARSEKVFEANEHLRHMDVTALSPKVFCESVSQSIRIIK